MKNSVLAIIFIVAAAGCVGQADNVLKSVIDISVIAASATEDMSITAKVPEFARQNREFNWQIVAEPTVDVKDFNISVYDPCKFTPVSGDDVRIPVDIKANRTKIYTLTYSLGPIDFEGDCEVRFKTQHTSEATASTTVVALSDAEWQQRKARGTLSEIPVSSYSSNNPLKVSISWSEDQHFLDQSVVQMYIDYENLGSGFITKLAKDSVKITVPNTLTLVSPLCDDYMGFSNEGDHTAENNTIAGNQTTENNTNTIGYVANGNQFTELKLSRDLELVAKKAKRSTCNFKVDAKGKDINSQSITATAVYVYETDNSVKIPLLKK